MQCSSTIEGIISGSDLTSDISGYIDTLDTNVTLYLIGSDIEFKFRLNIFNGKELNIQFNSASTGTFDISGSSNIDIHLSFLGVTNVYPTVKLQGSAFKDDKTSISLQKIKLEADFSEIQIKHFSTQDSSFTFTSFTTNSLCINANAETEITLKDNSVVYSNQIFSFTGENPLVLVELKSNRQLVIDNQASSSSFIPSLLIQTVQSVTFKGNDFSSSNSISLLDCPIIATDVSYLPISSFLFSGSSSSDVKLIVNKPLTIKGTLSLLSSRDLIIEISENIASRIAIIIESITLETGEIQLLSSWIDLTIDNFKFKSTTPPLIPCIGYGGSSTLTANQINLDGQAPLSFNSISIKLDFTEELTDNELSKLINSQWNIITFKSFTNAVAVAAFDPITFTPENINGFGKSESTRIISVKSTISSDYTVTLAASSMSALPYLICFVKPRGSCTKGGKTIASLSDLSTAVPPDKKSIKLIINKAYAEINLSVLQTTGAEFIIEYDQSEYPIISISMGNEFPNSKVDHIILNGLTIGNLRGGDSFLQLNSREITLNNCQNTSETKITFNENSIVNIDKESYDQLLFYISNSFPQTNLITPIESITYFEISEDQYIFTKQSSVTTYSKTKLPKVAFQIELASNDDYALIYKTTASLVDSVDLKFISASSQSFNPRITVTFQNLDSITSANKIGIDFGPFNSKNTVDFSVYNKADYFQITGQNVNIIPDDNAPNGKICVCKTKPCAGCESDYTQTSYSDLQQTIQAYTGNSFRIVVIGDQDGSTPILPIGIVNQKDVTIVGSGTNPKIQIDCSSEYNDESKAIEFSKITIARSTGNSLHISNLKLSEGAIIDSSFNTASLTVGNLECDVSNLAFSSISVQKSLVLCGDAANTNSNAKVSFSTSSKFTFTLSKSITISGSKLVFNNLEFDLTNVLPEFTFPSDSDEFTIVGSNGNIDSIGSDILLQSANLNAVHFTGTWNNKNPSKFFVFRDFSADLYLNSEDIPVSFEYSSFKNIELGKEKVGIAGTVSLSNASFGSYKISTAVADATSTLSIKEIIVSYETSGTVDIDFESSNINLNIDYLNLMSKFKIIKFNILVDLNNQNQVNIANEFDQSRYQALKYSVTCTITDSLNHPQMSYFIANNHTLISVNQENTIQLQNSITFDDRAPPGFDGDHFKLSNDDSKLIFYTAVSPTEGEIDLYYGNCGNSCKGTQIKNEDLSLITNIIPKEASIVIIRFYESLPDNSILNLDIPDLSIKYLTLSSDSEIRTIPVKFGNSVTNLDVELISMKNDANDAFSIKKAKLTKGASFSNKANLRNLELLIVDKESLFALEIAEFNNRLEVLLELANPSELILSYTKTGMKVTNSQSKEFNIDVSELSNVSLYVKSKETPKINLENDVTELKQVQQLVFDSSLIHIGSNWNLLKTSVPLVSYSIEPQETAVSVVTDSFPFEAWDLMYKYSIQFSDVLSPFTYSDEYEINGQKLTFSTYSPSTSKHNDVLFNEIIMNGESSIKLISEQSDDKALIIDELRVKKSSSSKVINAQIKAEVVLEQGSTLSDDFTLIEGFSELEIEWDLNEVPLLNPMNLQTIIPANIDIKYVGRSIEGREQAFQDFLSNGVPIIKNFNSCNEIIQKIHFKSEGVDEFNDGIALSIQCQCVNDNEIHLFSNDKLIPITTSSSSTQQQTTTATQQQTTTATQQQTTTATQQQTTTATQQQTEEITTSSSIDESIQPTPIIPVQGPTVDQTSYNLGGQSVEFTKDGYKDTGVDHSSSNNENQILLINANSPTLTISTTKDRPNNDLYLSPKSKNTHITVVGDDFGDGEIGIHANSNNPAINLPQSKVPLKLFNSNEESEVHFMLNGQTANSLILNKLVVNNGNVKLNVPSSVTSLYFDTVEVYNNGNIQSLFGQNLIETNIDFLEMKAGSTAVLSNAKFGETLKSAPHSKLVINEKSKFDETTSIKLTETSFIEFGNSIVEGVCKEIKLVEVLLQSKLNLRDEESEIQLVCGSHFNCSSWLPKYTGNKLYPSAKCINFKSTNDICLVASTKSEKTEGNDGNDGNEQKKNTLSGGVIAGICIGCVVVAGLLIGIVLYCVKRKHAGTQYNVVGEADELYDNPSHI